MGSRSVISHGVRRLNISTKVNSTSRAGLTNNFKSKRCFSTSKNNMNLGKIVVEELKATLGPLAPVIGVGLTIYLIYKSNVFRKEIPTHHVEVAVEDVKEAVEDAKEAAADVAKVVEEVKEETIEGVA